MVAPSFLTIWAERRQQIKGTVSANHLHSTWCRVMPRCCSHTGEEELKHDLNELCIYVHKLIWFCEVVWRATDLVVLTF